MEVVNSNEPPEVILRSSNPLKSCVCSRTWVLVVHNDFLQVEGYERVGNDVDLQNLRRVFQSERECEFAELANCNKAQILETLTSQQKLNQLFHPGRDSKFLIDFAIFLLNKNIVRSRESTRGNGAVLPVLISVGILHNSLYCKICLLQTKNLLIHLKTFIYSYYPMESLEEKS